MYYQRTIVSRLIVFCYQEFGDWSYAVLVFAGCVFLDAEGGGAVKTCRPPGIARRNLFRSLYLEHVHGKRCAQFSYRWISINDNGAWVFTV